MTEPTIRRATAADAPSVGHLVRRLLEPIVPAARLTPQAVLAETAGRVLSGDGLLAWIAEAEGKAVGMIASIQLYAIFALGAFGEITELYVEPEWRASGLAGRLVGEVQAHGRERGWSRLELTAPPAGSVGAERAWAFYKRLGFGKVGPRMMLAL